MKPDIKSRKFHETNDCIAMEFILKREGSRANDSHIPIIRRLITIGEHFVFLMCFFCQKCEKLNVLNDQLEV